MFIAYTYEKNAREAVAAALAKEGQERLQGMRQKKNNLAMFSNLQFVGFGVVSGVDGVAFGEPSIAGDDGKVLARDAKHRTAKREREEKCKSLVKPSNIQRFGFFLVSFWNWFLCVWTCE